MCILSRSSEGAEAFELESAVGPRTILIQLLPAVVVAIGLIVFLGLEASAQLFGPSGCCRYADSSTHTWLDSEPAGAGNTEWEDHFENSMNQDLAQTDMSEFEVTYHYNGNLTYPYVDVSWWATTSIYPASGKATCDKVYSSEKCDHWHVQFYEGSTASEWNHDRIACHEIGHTVGLDHAQSTSSCMHVGSGAHIYDSHDLFHINGRY